ncbi:MAG: TetR family transcriptional regulator [Paenibacillaceae bacterium]|jgi:AcrR family transcriptional regulator|nr:TetR family transcriptional regulator [Paenibacillaceae bacterium]
MSPRIGADLASILSAAVELADSQGLDEVTMASLAAKLNIRSPSLYNHIAGLPALRNRLAIHGLEEICAGMERACAGQRGKEAIRSVARAYVAFAREHPGLHEATIRAPDPREPELRQAGERVVELVLRLLDDCGLTGAAALHAVRGVRSLIHGFASLEQKGGFALALPLEDSFDLLIDAFLAGIGVYELKL